MTNISKAAFARELGVSKARISQLISSGLPVDGDGSIAREAALNWIKDNVLPPHGGRKVKSSGLYSAARRLLERDDADRGELADDRLNPIYRTVSLLEVAARVELDIAAVLIERRVGDARGLADAIAARIIHGVALFVDDLALDGEAPPPPHGGKWVDHVWFAPSPIPDHDWEEASAGSLR